MLEMAFKMSSELPSRLCYQSNWISILGPLPLWLSILIVNKVTEKENSAALLLAEGIACFTKAVKLFTCRHRVWWMLLWLT